ncbi:hypothetical protein AC578_2128 [Pseudocercospora eumusae]|uniref:Serine/threonine-protein phosphatase 2A activator n=1 Tax=Pseudocercospora eumusae TaxID=321146 RepID=A0A139HQI2_9PEZI|nr:hypothetical protein AC578_2128 [Pseudocercospora eumusae]
MTQSIRRATTPVLERVQDVARHPYAVPSKKINDGDDLASFFTSTAYRDLTTWLFQLTRAMFPEKQAGATPKACTLDAPPEMSSQMLEVGTLLQSLSDLIDQAPPDTGPRRFGNVAFRNWYQLAEQKAPSLLDELLKNVLSTSFRAQPLRDELKAYLLGSFGSAQRLDYGTGHELSFLAFLGCLWKLSIFKHGDEQAIVVGLVQPYLELVRRLISTYTLEPAGSHGVWGLDDHSFLPYIFGSAQLGPAISKTDESTPIPMEGSLPTAPSPTVVTNKALVADFKDSNMYFSAIQFIYDVKRGPFWEHSPVLYDISGIKDGWGKINKGMLKMYAAEVLGKFPVVQHFPFGSLFRWEKDPEAPSVPQSTHAKQQPVALQSKDVPPAVGAGTAAPWAKPGNAGLPQMHVNAGMPSMRAPWATGNAPSDQTQRKQRF